MLTFTLPHSIDDSLQRAYEYRIYPLRFERDPSTDLPSGPCLRQSLLGNEHLQFETEALQRGLKLLEVRFGLVEIQAAALASQLEGCLQGRARPENRDGPSVPFCTFGMRTSWMRSGAKL